ncbi:MAG TPA: hypothetical protein VK184_05755 [Nostocaceae cyanobacterium]|nr:hypothetical protein [Nostocaceae cyanobacterium]
MIKRLIPVACLILGCSWLVGCESSATKPSPDSSSNIVETPINSPTATTATTTATTTPEATNQPKIGTIKELVSGDLKCYVTLVDENGQEHNLGATFEVCEQQTLVNKKVSLSYSLENVSDCESAEPCGKTRQESLISKIEPVSE